MSNGKFWNNVAELAALAKNIPEERRVMSATRQAILSDVKPSTTYTRVVVEDWKQDPNGVRVTVAPETVPEFLAATETEVHSARAKFPGSDGLLAALMEEVGELSKALVEESAANVWAEAVQVAAMALRIATEGDPVYSEIRKRRGLDDLS